MIYKMNDYDSLLGMAGFSDTLLKNHFTLYGGYVKNTNMLLEILRGFAKEDGSSGHPFSEVQRRLPFEFNGMRLHEYYFENMAKEGRRNPDKDSLFYKALVRQFRTYGKWEQNFRDVALLRGAGWTVTVYDPRSGLVLNTWVDEHHLGHIAGTVPIVVADLWEHAMLLDYGSDRKKYLDAFLNALKWETVSCRFEKALKQRETSQVDKRAR